MKSIYLFILSLSLLTNCSKQSQVIETNCKEILLANNDIITSVNSDLDIIEISIKDNCIVFNIGYRGCNSNHDIDILTTGALIKTNPPQLDIGFRDNNPENCDAYFIEEHNYSLSQFRKIMANAESMWLNINDSKKRYLYKK